MHHRSERVCIYFAEWLMDFVFYVNRCRWR
jgi:hypothetical protein